MTIFILGWLVLRVLWHINLCRLFNAKSIFMKINSSISDNSVLFQIIQPVIYNNSV